ncbi:MAG: alanine racemase, partial [Vicinamibacterales bacterium]|nr:alanine racemase [Vicinamibacterales bacterium]
MPRPILATFHRAAFAHNLARIRRAAPRSRVWAVVKANAYGHGLGRAASGLAEADGFALLEVDAAVRLRSLGVTKPVLLLEGVFDVRELATAAALGLDLVVHCAEQVDMIESTPLPRPVRAWLKMNSGMNRLGVRPEAYAALHARLARSANVASVALLTHFADADGERGVAEQLARFTSAAEPLAGERSLANSAATLRHPSTHADWVRPGIAIYGCSPFADESAAALALAPVMTVSSELIATQTLAPGDRVGYGGTFTATQPMRIGVVAAGYADGYPRHAPTGTPILVDGVRTRTVGRVSMDMITVDLSPVPQAGIGTAVTLWGDGLSCDEVAAAAGTVSYELLCALAARVPQV